MLPRADINVTPVGRATPAASTEGAGDARQEAFQRSLATLLGKSVQGEILSKLTDGSFIVRIAGASARMLLPAGAEVGKQVPLTLVALTPRPTFEISGNAGNLAYSEAGPALLPGPPGAAARAAPLVYLEGGQRGPGAPKLAPPPLPGNLGGPAPQLFLEGGDATPDPGVPKLAPPPLQAPPAAGAPLLQPLTDKPAAAMAAAPLLVPQDEVETAASTRQPPPLSPGGAPQTRTEALQRADSAQRTAHAVALLGKAPLIPADQLPALDPKSTPTQLSDAARLISNVLNAAAKGGEQAPAAIVARTPLVNAATVAPEKVAVALQTSVAESGVFYESHLAEWAEGKRPVSDLAREPQMQRMAQNDPRPVTDPATAQFINQQLTTHEQGRLMWQGQPWPGMPVELEVRKEVNKDAPEGRGRDGEAAPEPSWRSAVRLRFAALGEIGATVVMHGEQIHIQVNAGSSGIGALLREYAGELSGAMEAAGLPLSSLNIRATHLDTHHDKAKAPDE